MLSIGSLSREALAIGGSSRSTRLKWSNGLSRFLVRKVTMLAINGEDWRGIDVRREEVCEEKSSRMLCPGINRTRAMALALLPSDGN